MQLANAIPVQCIVSVARIHHKRNLLPSVAFRYGHRHCIHVHRKSSPHSTLPHAFFQKFQSNPHENLIIVPLNISAFMVLDVLLPK